MVYVNEEKLNNFYLNDNNFCVVMDFDATITTSSSLGSWSVLENPNFMNPDFKIESGKLVDKYYPIELDYSLDAETKAIYMQEWYSKNMNLFYKYNLTWDILLKCVSNSNVALRNGAKDFLNMLANRDIPVVILSAGIGNVIVEFLKLNNCLYNNIFIVSNFIKFDNGKMLPFNDEMITTSNKSIDKLPVEIRNKINEKDYILLFGDLIEDLNMVHKEDLSRSISFGFLEKNVDKNFEFYRNSFDVVLTDNSSFNEVKKVLAKNKK